MKQQHAERGQAPHASQTSRNTRRCLPFCGLGAERAVLGEASARVFSTVHLKARNTAQAEGVDAPTRS